MSARRIKRLWKASSGKIFDELAKEEKLEVRALGVSMWNYECFPKVPYFGELPFSDLVVANRNPTRG